MNSTTMDSWIMVCITSKSITLKKTRVMEEKATTRREKTRRRMDQMMKTTNLAFRSCSAQRARAWNS